MNHIAPSTIVTRPLPVLRLVETPPIAAEHDPLVVTAEAALEATRPASPTPLQMFWHWVFRPPTVDLQTVARDSGVFRALYEVGSDYLPSSGTWPAP